MFENIHIGSEVEVCKKNGDVLRAKVKWKGNITGRIGEWIGVELFHPEGKHDGFIDRRRYYQCKPNHGLFARSSQIRFIKSKPSCCQKMKKYKTVSNQSCVEESLFLRGNLEEPANQNSRKKFVSLSSTTFNELMDVAKNISLENDSFMNTSRTFRKSHTVGNCLNPAKKDMRKGDLSMTNTYTSPRYLRKTDPSFNYFLTSRSSYTDRETFRSPSSIPVTCRTPAHCCSMENFYRSKSVSRLSLNKTI